MLDSAIVNKRILGALRLTGVIAAVVFAVGGGLVPVVAASAAPAHQPCAAQQEVSSCDADGDTIPDTVERVVSGSATGATGREDADKDGIPDWTEVMACGSTRCASPTKDSVGDGIPDYARILMCGSSTCYADNADVNANGVPRWASVVICGTSGCATGHEDYDADGVSDAVELAACVKPRTNLASTGQTIAIWLLVAIAGGLVATGVVLARKRSLFQAAIQPAMQSVEAG
jgi:LPXTG-motif cell wall-anchored protein